MTAVIAPIADHRKPSPNLLKCASPFCPIEDARLFTDFPLNSQIFKALEKLGLAQPTPVQQQTIPRALAQKDLLVSAETGSGKTLAFLLPILQRLMENPAPDSATRALILVPTRELARQVFKNAKDLSAFTRVEAGMIMGGQEFKYQKALLRKNPEIVIATPGRLVEHLSQNSADLSDLEVLVLDEADRMLDMGLSEDVLKIAKACRRERQTLLFSATLTHKGVLKVAEQVLNNPETLTLSTPQDKHANITQQVVLADDPAHKERLTNWLLANETYSKALIFTNTKLQAEKLQGLLKFHNHPVGLLHGDMDQDERNQIMTQLRHGAIEVLVATDVAARGLDIRGIDLVINFDMPRNGNDYIHRIGRTGRAGEQGLAITFVAAPDWNLMTSVEHYLQLSFERRKIKSLEARFKGPKKIKTSGKTAATQKRKDSKKDTRKTGKKDDAPKVKKRLRDQKNIGKRRKPTAAAQDGTSTAKASPRKWGSTPKLDEGWAPIKKKVKKQLPLDDEE